MLRLNIQTCALIISSFFIAQYGLAQQNETRFSPKELAAWPTYGIGKSTVENDELIVEETDGSDGFFLISPEAYTGDMTLTYKVKALSESSVQIVLFSASGQGETLDFDLPPADATPREVWNWRTTLEHYNLTFNNISHGNKPFFFKNISPSEMGFRHNQQENVMEPEAWYDVQIDKIGTQITFRLNNKVVFDVKDHEPLKGGHLMFRISGTNGSKIIFAKAAYKDVVLKHQ